MPHHSAKLLEVQARTSRLGSYLTQMSRHFSSTSSCLGSTKHHARPIANSKKDLVQSDLGSCPYSSAGRSRCRSSVKLPSIGRLVVPRALFGRPFPH